MSEIEIVRDGAFEAVDAVVLQIGAIAVPVPGLEVEEPRMEIDIHGYMSSDGTVRTTPIEEDVMTTHILATVDRAVILTVWGARWLKHTWGYVHDGCEAGVFAKVALKQMDDVEENPDAYLEQHTYQHSHLVEKFEGEGDNVRQVVKSEVVEKIKTKIRKGSRSKFAASIAMLAYNKFGERPTSEANMLITRKWIQKLLDDSKYKDLRLCDKNNAIDRALFLSFVPTKDFQRMKMAIATKPWEARMRADGVFGGFWGKVFGIARGPSGDSDDDQ